MCYQDPCYDLFCNLIKVIVLYPIAKVFSRQFFNAEIINFIDQFNARNSKERLKNLSRSNLVLPKVMNHEFAQGKKSSKQMQMVVIQRI